MKKLLIVFLILFSLNSFADEFLHEPDANFTISNIEMTTQPYLNNFLSINFKIFQATGLTAKNTHIHLKTFDDENRLIQDYSFKLVSKDSVIEKSLNHLAIDKSIGYSFYRNLPQEKNILEHRIVSDDNGLVSANLFLNACGLNEQYQCYLLSGVYKLEISAQGLKHDEYFGMKSEKIQTFSIPQTLSLFANNPRAIGVVIVLSLFFLILIFAIGFFVLRKLRRG